jgi:predicted DNA-binding transcriptional regulator YafY
MKPEKITFVLSPQEAKKLYTVLNGSFELSSGFLDDIDEDTEEILKVILKQLAKQLPKNAKDKSLEEYLETVFEENPWADLAGSHNAYSIIQRAMGSKKRVFLKYYSLNSSAITEREISPLELDSKYLKAFDHSKNEERTFRIGRIIQAKTVNKPARKSK